MRTKRTTVVTILQRQVVVPTTGNLARRESAPTFVARLSDDGKVTRSAFPRMVQLLRRFLFGGGVSNARGRRL